MRNLHSNLHSYKYVKVKLQESFKTTYTTHYSVYTLYNVYYIVYTV